ncbi:MAG TPA: class I SAM-dependent methyltransferase [Actinomycetota bacterium]|nr:class I SAM-dependent methyltransferase [Actinomycetota bacterium]
MNLQTRELLRSDLSQALDAVEGWLHPAEAWALLESARDACPSVEQPLAVEIGSYKGRSAIALASGLKARGRGALVAIDPFEMEQNQQEVFRHNLERAGVADLVEPIVAYSHDARPKVADRSVSVLFVDGSHEYEDVMQDVHDWLPAMVDGGVVAFNDPFWGGVARALRDTVAIQRSPLRNPRLIVNTLFFDYLPDAGWTSLDEVRRLRLRAFLKAGRFWYNRLHVRITENDRLPVWVKKLQLRLAVLLIGPLVRRPRGDRMSLTS